MSAPAGFPDGVNADIFAAIAAGLCLDSGVRIVSGRRWMFNATSRTIEIDEALLASDPERAIGLLCHEVGHVWVSRYHLFPAHEVQAAIWATFLNAIEDPRVNLYMLHRYPGTRAWFDQMFVADRTGAVTTPSRFLRWCGAASVADAYAWSARPDWVLRDAAVLDALGRTEDCRRQYAEELPRIPSHHKCSPRTDESPEVRELMQQTPEEKVQVEDLPAILSAARALAIAIQGVLPPVLKLIEWDEAALAGFFASHPEKAEAAEKALRHGRSDPMPLIDEALRRGDPDGGGKSESSLARRALARYVAGDRGLRPGDAMQMPESELAQLSLRRRMILRGGRPRSQRVDRLQIARSVQRQLPLLVRDMESILSPTEKGRRRAGSPSGQSVDLRRAMAFEADRRGYDRLWVRMPEPTRPQAAISLLVDLSGSMRGKEIEAAITGTSLLAETLDRMAPMVRFAVNGFQDELIPFIRFGDALTNAHRNALYEMAHEVVGDRPGGHNQPSYNDDGPCLEQAGDELAKERGQRLLFVVSDGRPSGRRSNVADLRRAIERFSGREYDLTLFGLGLGPGTNHVKEFYPNAIADIPVDGFARELGQLLRRVLRGEGR